ncbi:hypothetical protein ABDM40_06790 [Klebsiella pneumoniae]
MARLIGDVGPAGRGQAVSHACVFNRAAATGGDARQLVGYLVSDSGLPLDTAALKARLAEQLPPHMVPVVLMQLAELPLSANGKLDRKRCRCRPSAASAAVGRRSPAWKLLSPPSSASCWAAR